MGWGTERGDTQDERREAERDFRERVSRIEAACASSLPEALSLLANGSADPAMRRSVLMRADLPLDAILAASCDPDETVRAFAVGLAAATDAVIRAAETDPAWQVRAEVARRSDCPVDILERLSLDPDAVVRRAAIAHSHVHAGVLLRVLTVGTSRLDAELAAAHPALDVMGEQETLLRANAFGALALLRRDDLPEPLLARFSTMDYPVTVRVAAVRQERCPADVIGATACADPSPEVRQAAAARTKCPPTSLLDAAADPESAVRRVVAANESSPPEAVRLLLIDDDDVVRREAAKSNCADPELLATLVTTDHDAKVRKAALANRRCPARVVDAACADPQLVFTAAMNRACSKEGAFAALLTIRVMPRQASKGQADTEQRQRDRVRGVAKRAVALVAKQDWAWIQAHDIDRLHPDDLAAVISGHLVAAAGDSREVVRLAASTCILDAVGGGLG